MNTAHKHSASSSKGRSIILVNISEDWYTVENLSYMFLETEKKSKLQEMKKKKVQCLPSAEHCNPQHAKVKWSRHRPSVAQRVGRGIALLFHDHGTWREWVVSSTPRLHFTPGKDPEPILQEAGWAPWLVWMGRKSRPHQDSILDHPACSQSLYRLSYLAQILRK